jgi:RimJ/RimL family protein N-acetyltransferase
VNILETDRLTLRVLSVDDAPFMLELLNDPGWLRFIGDRGVRTLEQARAYILNGPVALYERFGFGFYLVELKANRAPIGVCSLIKRDFLDAVDLGYALLPSYAGHGYAFEAAAALIGYAARELGLRRLVAIASQDNHRSGRLLEKLGFHFERLVRYPGEAAELALFARDAA